MTSISALTPLLALQITARVPTADKRRQTTPFCNFAVCNNTLSKTADSTLLHPPRKQRCNTLYFARKECGRLSLCTPSKQSKMCTHSHILFCSFKAIALSIYPRFHSDIYKKHNRRIGYIPDRQIMLFCGCTDSRFET